MAIINSEVETLIHTRSVQQEVTLKSLMEQSRDMDKKWVNHIVNNENKTNFAVNSDLQLVINPVHGGTKTMLFHSFVPAWEYPQNILRNALRQENQTLPLRTSEHGKMNIQGICLFVRATE